MLGAIIGDIVGSRFEWHNIKSKEFALFTGQCRPTDDSIMTLALAGAILASRPDYRDLSQNAVKYMQEVGRQYPNCGYGGRFYHWIFSDHPQPYQSFGNGAAMRVSGAGFAAASLEQAKELARKITEVTHNHPEGLKGAEATAAAIYLARTGSSIPEIREMIQKHYYRMDFTLDGIRDSYRFDESCQGTVPQALEAFFESTGFEDAIRNAVSLGGDSDTLAAICGGVAEAYYGIPDDIRSQALHFLDDRQLDILKAFEAAYPPVPGHPAGWKMTRQDFAQAAGYWDQKDAAGVKMPREQLMQAMEAYIRANNTCALATGAGTFIRCTPIEYSYHDGAFWMFSEGGKKLLGLARNPNVCLAIYDKYNGFGTLHGMQVTGKAEMIEPFSEAYKAHAAHQKIPLEALRQLLHPMHLIRVQPERIDYLCSDFKKQGFDSRQAVEF